MKTYHNLCIKCHAYTMYPAWNIHLLILYTPHHADQSQQPTVLCTHLPDQCTAIYPSVVTRISIPLQYAWTLPTAPKMQHQSPLTMRNHQVRMRISRQYLWTMNIGQQRWFQERTFCIHENGLPNNVCSYPCPYEHIGTATYIDSLDLSDISDLEDHFLTTSDDEDLPGLEEVPY